MQTTILAAGNNFLVPNWTFVAELIAFLIILYILWRYVVPPVQKAMRERQNMIQRQVEESEQASKRLHEAEQKYQEFLAEARTEAAKIRESARSDAQHLREEMREQANAEVERLRQRGEEELGRRREQIVRELRGEIGDLAIQLADRIVGESLEDDQRQRRVVDRMLTELEQRPPDGSSSRATSHN